MSQRWKCSTNHSMGVISQYCREDCILFVLSGLNVVLINNIAVRRKHWAIDHCGDSCRVSIFLPVTSPNAGLFLLPPELAVNL